MAVFRDQSQRKYGTGPGSNSRPLDLQSDLESVARHVTDCATWPGLRRYESHKQVWLNLVVYVKLRQGHQNLHFSASGPKVYPGKLG